MDDICSGNSGLLPFVLEGVKIVPRQLPEVPAISLHLMADDYPQDCLAHNDYQRLMTAPPYWAFCWGGGQALARWILQHPAAVAGRVVIDFGAGSGVAGISAALAGAASVLCVDIDADALRACERNAQLNRVSVLTSNCLPPLDDALLLAADVCYEDQGFASVINHIVKGADAIVAESRLRDLSERFSQLRKVSEYKVRTLPDLEESENYDLVNIFCTQNL